MVKKTSSKSAAKAQRAEAPAPATIGIVADNSLQTTGRYIVIFKKEAMEAGTVKNTLAKTAGLRNVVNASEFKGTSVSGEALADKDAVNFESLGIALVGNEEAIASLSAATASADSPIQSIEPEYIAYLSSSFVPRLSLEYLQGYKDAVNQLYDSLTQGIPEAGALDNTLLSTFEDDDQFTWGLKATKVHSSRFSGKGIKLAVLDTGFDFHHPDFKGRLIVSESFSGAPVQDVNGHGTHCIGTACGSLRPATGVCRYGVAHAAQIYAGKVFNNDAEPSAATGDILAGIEWAISNGCSIVSLSLGVRRNQKVEQYEEPIRRALAAGTLIVAAAGNNASRPANRGFVEPPANADAAMAVGAVDNRLNIAPFSADSSTVTGAGGKVNIAGPGVKIFSSVPVDSGRHDFFDGTSMATPHVAGIAALWAEATGENGQALWNKLVQTAMPLSLSSAAVGSGLVQAPQ